MAKKSIVKEITYGVFGSLIDLLLYQVYLVGASVGKTGPQGFRKAFWEADKALEEFNHNTIVNMWNQMIRKDLIVCNKRKDTYKIILTSIGKKRLSKTISSKDNYLWDGKIYLVIFDIPEKAHKKRDLLRRYLMKQKCRLLQESIWLNLYNPGLELNQFILKHEIPGVIFISEMDSNSSLGETSLKQEIIRLFSLDRINKRYRNFVANSEKSHNSSYMKMMEYLSIAKDDPKVPRELLPSDWCGFEANVMYEKEVKKYIQSCERPRGK